MFKYTVKCLLLLLCLWVVYIFGRSLWYPIYRKVKGPETVSSIVEKIGPTARQRLQPALSMQGFEGLPMYIKLQAFKQEQQLEVYASDSIEVWTLLQTYPFTATSGSLGPKLKEGDRQIPEGIYHIEYLNPNSSYHLSAKISYPNAFDKAKAALFGRTDLGGDIMIHGKASTVGCIPIGDEHMEELFLLLQKALPQGVEVVISPRDFRVDTTRPIIGSVEWETELYDSIAAALLK